MVRSIDANLCEDAQLADVAAAACPQGINPSRGTGDCRALPLIRAVIVGATNRKLRLVVAEGCACVASFMRALRRAGTDFSIDDPYVLRLYTDATPVRATSVLIPTHG